jgi:light-dependent protochlorophyllide reductase
MNTAIVTGANTGLGFECALALAETRDWHVIVACRSADKGREAVKRLIAQTRQKEIETVTLDLASLESVRKFARAYEAEKRPLRAIVCNAATQIVTGRTFTKDGFETTFAVNHLGHFLLVNLMLAQMAPTARIVVVSSGTHDPAQTTGMPPPLYRRARILARPDEDSKPLDDPRGTAGRRAYTTSKLCNVLFTYELDRRLRAEKAVGQNGNSITVNAFDPGLMPGTGLARDYGRMARFAWRFVLPVLRPFVPNVNSVARSGRSLASMVTEPRFERISGKYFQGARDVPSSKDSYDPAIAAELWESSAAMVKLTPDETILRLRSTPSAA